MGFQNAYTSINLKAKGVKCQETQEKKAKSPEKEFVRKILSKKNYTWREKLQAVFL